MKALLVDSLNVVRRLHAATAEPAADGDAMGAAIISAAASLKRALRQHRPSHCVAVFAQGGHGWRYETYPGYKQGRAPMPAALGEALPRFERAFSELAVACVSPSGYEADDIIATIALKIARHCRRGDRGAVILSTDRHYCQLLGAHIAVFDHFARRFLDDDMIMQKFGVKPQQLTDLLALTGDRGRAIAGVKSIGIRTAAKLLKQHSTLENILAMADAGGLSRQLGGALRRDRAAAQLAKTLFTLKTDIDLGINLKQLRWRAPAEFYRETGADAAAMANQTPPAPCKPKMAT